MALIDSLLEFSSSQALTVVGALATNVIDFTESRSVGVGEPLSVMFTVEVAADQTTGDEDYTFDLEVATDTGITAGRQLLGRRIFESGTPTAPAQNADLLVAGFVFAIPVPPTRLSESARYLAVRYTLAGTTPLLTVSADLVPNNSIPMANIYPDGFTIS